MRMKGHPERVRGTEQLAKSIIDIATGRRPTAISLQALHRPELFNCPQT
jgi:hypothetical protein